MHWEQPIQYASLSDIGFRRQMNQDASIVQMCSDPAIWRERGHLFLVADGMGGHAVGELASKMAVDTIPHTFFKSRNPDRAAALREAVEAANSVINERGKLNRDFERMGTTCAAVVLCPEGALIAHVGDSRVYRIRRGRIDQLTFDHSLQWEMMRQGKSKPEEILLHEPRHIITRSLGPEPTVKVDIDGPFPVQPGDVFLLCSDGLNGHVRDEEIGVIASHLAPAEAVRLLVNLTNLRGGSDNVTVVIARSGAVPQGINESEPLAAEPPHDRSHLMWLAGFWGIAAGAAASASFFVAGSRIWGVTLGVFTAIAAVTLAILWRRVHGRLLPLRDSDETVAWSPYRTAPAKLNRELLTHLAAVEAELLRMASEEGWDVDQVAHQAVWEQAKHSFDDGDYAAALRHHGKAIEILMAGVHRHRQQLRRAAKRRKPEAKER